MIKYKKGVIYFHQAELISSPPNVSGGHPQIGSMPTQSIVQETCLLPPYDVDIQPDYQDPDLLLVPLATTPVPPQETGRPPPYTGDTQTCSQGPDLLLVPLEATPIPPQEIDPPPPYHQISTTESDMWSLHDGDQPPPYSACTEQQVRVKYFVSLFRKRINTLPCKVDLLTKFGTFYLKPIAHFFLISFLIILSDFI